MLYVVCILYSSLSTVLEHSAAPYSPKQGSSTSALLIWAWIIFYWGGGCPVHCRVWNSSPGLYPRDAMVMMTPNVLRQCPVSLGAVNFHSVLVRSHTQLARHTPASMPQYTLCSHHPHLPPPSPSLKTRLQCFPLQKAALFALHEVITTGHLVLP